MNKNDYKEIAKIVKSYYDVGTIASYFITDLADYFEKESYYYFGKMRMSRFNRKQFLKDAGGE